MQISKNLAFVKFSCLYKTFQESLFFEGFESVETDSEKSTESKFAWDSKRNKNLFT